MGLFKNGLSAIGRLLTVVALAGTFLVGLFGVVYLQLRGEEIEIPKVVGKNFNDGKDELTTSGLRIKKIATRYSKEEPNTILEQRPKAGTVAKTGLMISVIVSEPNPDGNEEPVNIKDDEEAIEEIESLPELKTDKTKKKSKSKTNKAEVSSRDVVKKKVSKKEQTEEKKSKPGDILAGGESKTEASETKKTEPKNDNKKTPPKPKTEKPNPPKKDNKPKTNGDSRSRKVSDN